MKRRLAAVAVMVLAASAATWADTLVLTSGRRVQGELIGVSGSEIEFAERGWSRRVVRVPRSEIVRIEFEPQQQGWAGGPNGGGRDDVGGIPRGMRERQVSVTARTPWTDTGIEVRAGQQIFFSSTGEVRWGPNRRDDAGGEDNSPVNANRPIPDRPAAALIARIGDRQDVFFIGDDTAPIRARSSGRLYLGINDDYLEDNSGSLRVKVSY
jgi:hypothetical protein